MKDIYRSPQVILGTSVLAAASLLLVGCTSSGNGDKPAPKRTVHTTPVPQPFNKLTIEYRGGQAYGSYDNGPSSYPVADFVESCQGTALVVSTTYEDNQDGGHAGTTVINLNAPQCYDGKLTASDFALPTAIPTLTPSK